MPLYFFPAQGRKKFTYPLAVQLCIYAPFPVNDSAKVFQTFLLNLFAMPEAIPAPRFAGKSRMPALPCQITFLFSF